jgi:hypothetical protein
MKGAMKARKITNVRKIKNTPTIAKKKEEER